MIEVTRNWEMKGLLFEGYQVSVGDEEVLGIDSGDSSLHCECT